MFSRKSRVGRNDPCPCGSGKKYKQCCLRNKKTPDVKHTPDYYLRRHQVILKTPEQVEGIRRAGVLVVDLLDRVEQMIRPGLVTDEINAFVDEYTRSHGAISAPLNYRGYPKSVCVSVNEVICHGIPGEWALKDGDIVNVDVTPILNGYYADGNKTFFVGTPNADARKIVSVARESLRLGMSVVKPGSTVGDIGWAIQQYAEGQGCSVVREYVGHGVGLKFHERPDIPHYGHPGRGLELVPGMTFTIEPMVNLGRHSLYVLDDDWTAVTEDGSLSAQFEQTLVVTDAGYESLTPYDLEKSM
ncbi:MAG: type I methionyl aminopeptidase [Kiritimatiellae bacterium]|nr:type I methionyl aminopeptidase [Kiritimatiellia bacterium]